MRVTITGASGLIGIEARRRPRAARRRGDAGLAAPRPARPGRARRPRRRSSTSRARTSPSAGPTTPRAAIRESREQGTRQLVEAIAQADPKPRALVSSSAVGYYGPHGDERLDEDTPPGDDFLAEVCVAWEREADRAAELGLRVVKVRTGVVLDTNGGALSKMLLPFKLGGGGPVAGGRQYMPWIHVDDVVGIYLRAIDDPAWHGAVNATAPEPVTNKTFSKALGPALHRPAVAPDPRAAIRLLYGDMAEIVTKGQRVDPEAHARARLHVPARRSRRGARAAVG